jgi:hypothetical protein
MRADPANSLRIDRKERKISPTPYKLQHKNLQNGNVSCGRDTDPEKNRVFTSKIRIFPRQAGFRLGMNDPCRSKNGGRLNGIDSYRSGHGLPLIRLPSPLLPRWESSPLWQEAYVLKLEALPPLVDSNLLIDGLKQPVDDVLDVHALRFGAVVDQDAMPERRVNERANVFSGHVRPAHQ